MTDLATIPSERPVVIVVGTRNVPVDAHRFWLSTILSGVEKCWNWNKAISPTGYGKFSFRVGRFASATTAHRVAYQIAVGPIPQGLVIDHLCRNKRCVNPAHLEAVTNKVNVIDRAPTSICAIQAAKTHCPRGHELSGDNLYRHGLRRGRRICRTCESTRAREFYRNNKERFACWKRRHNG